MSDISAAILSTQLDVGPTSTSARRAIWDAYHEALAPLEQAGWLARPALARDIVHNGHIYWLLAPSHHARDVVISTLAEHGIRAQFHYVPLHSAPAGVRYGRAAADLSITDTVASRLLRLPLWVGRTGADVELVTRVLLRSPAAMTPST